MVQYVAVNLDIFRMCVCDDGHHAAGGIIIAMQLILSNTVVVVIVVFFTCLVQLPRPEEAVTKEGLMSLCDSYAHVPGAGH